MISPPPPPLLCLCSRSFPVMSVQETMQVLPWRLLAPGRAHCCSLLTLAPVPAPPLQGFHPTKWGDLTTTLDGPEVQVFKQACVDNGGCLGRGRGGGKA